MQALIRIQKELKAPKNQLNKFGGYKYRSCEDILEAVKPLLQGAILTLSDEVVMLGHQVGCRRDPKGEFIDYTGRVYIKATATLSEADKSVSVTAWAREQDSRKGMDAAQVTGSASSYARKYALSGLFLCVDTHDPDHGDFQSGGSWDPTPRSQQESPPTQTKNNAPFPTGGPAKFAEVGKTKGDSPTPQQREWLRMAWDYYISKSGGKLNKVDAAPMQLFIQLIWDKIGHLPNSMEDVEKIKQWIGVEELIV